MSAFGTKRTSEGTQPKSAFGGKADMVRSGAVILKISLRICEGGLRFAEQTNFGPYPLEPEVAGNSWRAQSQQWPIALIRKLVRVPIASNHVEIID
jgi:hypothetical protein